MYWRAKGIYFLPCLDDFLFLIMGYDVGCLMAKIIEEDIHRAGFTINWGKSVGAPKHERLHLRFDVDLATGLFKVPITR